VDRSHEVRHDNAEDEAENRNFHDRVRKSHHG
jgi:hypothetical protein